ncbi:DUF2922 domain-containing protein [Enterococcus raffinosus]|uniref:DUF2922 domain-containing protein n=1 Tax=Enterococcus TaxID=1350 RepID=UPI001C48EEEC|nr:DUF2922 domain-containing protein [Enterococcus raffinosus]MDT2570856.1 DUF2922 domain-containing protein [Enterococcus raffinosus]QXJ57918.1 DUF2922 family protein [Enterococcus raffinosus]
MHRLAATFKNSNGKNHRWSLKNPNLDKSPEEIKKSLEKLTVLTVFDKEDAELFENVVTAKFVEKIETVIFDKTTETQQEPMERTEELNAVPSPTTLNLPEDLIISEETIESGLFMRSIEMPQGIDPFKLEEEQLLAVISSVIPDDAILKDAGIDDQTNPAKIVLILQLKDDIDEADRVKQPPD